MGPGAFRECTVLRKIAIPAGLDEVGECAFKLSGLKKIIIPKTLLTLGRDAFAECADLRNVVFQREARLEEIGNGCFRETGLRGVVLPDSVRELGNDVFANCERLENVSLNAGL